VGQQRKAVPCAHLGWIRLIWTVCSRAISLLRRRQFAGCVTGHQQCFCGHQTSESGCRI